VLIPLVARAGVLTARDGDRDWRGRLDMRTTLLRSGQVISLRPLAASDLAAVAAGVTGAPAGMSTTPRSLITWYGPEPPPPNRPPSTPAVRGDRALAALAFEDAVRWYERAAASLTALRAGDDEQAVAALRLGAARLAAEDMDGGRTGFRHAAERARRAGRPDLLARAALGLGGGPAGFEVGLLDGEQISLLEEARAALQNGHGTLVALVTARLSIASTLLLPEGRRLELAAEAVSQARSADNDAALAAALAALCDAVAGPDHCAARRAHATEIIDLAERLRDPVLGLLGRRLRLVALLEAGAIADWEADVLAYRAASGNAIMLVQTQLWRLRAEEGDTAGLLDMPVTGIRPGRPSTRRPSP
jgi:hypothetical protein